MLPFLEFIYSLPFVIGAFVGYFGQRCFAHAHVAWLNRYRPLPDGEQRVTRVSQTWLAGLLAAIMLGYVLLTSERTHEQAQRLTSDVTRCWSESYQAAKARADLNDQDATLTNELAHHRDDLFQANADWIGQLLNAPPDVGANIERRQQYMYDVTRGYFQRYGQIMFQIKNVEARQAQLAEQRRLHPLPEITCGR